MFAATFGQGDCTGYNSGNELPLPSSSMNLDSYRRGWQRNWPVCRARFF